MKSLMKGPVLVLVQVLRLTLMHHGDMIITTVARTTHLVRKVKVVVNDKTMVAKAVVRASRGRDVKNGGEIIENGADLVAVALDIQVTNNSRSSIGTATNPGPAVVVEIHRRTVVGTGGSRAPTMTVGIGTAVAGELLGS